MEKNKIQTKNNLLKLREIDENIIKDVRNIFKLKKKMDENSIKYVRNNFQLKKENKVIKERIIRDIRKSL